LYYEGRGKLDEPNGAFLIPPQACNDRCVPRKYRQGRAFCALARARAIIFRNNAV
jgi:hypothetical protein